MSGDQNRLHPPTLLPVHSQAELDATALAPSCLSRATEHPPPRTLK